MTRNKKPIAKQKTFREVMKELFHNARKYQKFSEVFYVDFKNRKLNRKVKDMVVKKKEISLSESIKNILI